MSTSTNPNAFVRASVGPSFGVSRRVAKWGESQSSEMRADAYRATPAGTTSAETGRDFGSEGGRIVRRYTNPPTQRRTNANRRRNRFHISVPPDRLSKLENGSAYGCGADTGLESVRSPTLGLPVEPFARRGASREWFRTSLVPGNDHLDSFRVFPRPDRRLLLR